VAGCGDGFVWEGMEGCDDGNGEEGDACPSGEMGMCKSEAGCGDGFVWDGMEGCDDGNGADTDACPDLMGQCKAVAGCGDGFVWDGMEDCDDGNVEDLDACNNMCAPPRWVFVTSTFSKGNLGGVTGADVACQGLAEGANLSGTYKAWLTGEDPASAPAQRFGSMEFAGWYRMPTNPPTPVARGWADLTSPNDDVPTNYLQNAIIADEKGIDVSPAKTWTNTTPEGTQLSLTEHCDDWTVQDPEVNGQSGLAQTGVLGTPWTNKKLDDCTGGASLYCFQTE
jgi:cysteine-rich repeat protein